MHITWTFTRGMAKESDVLAGWSPLRVCASGLQRIKQVQVTRLVVLQRDQRWWQRTQQLLVLCEERVIGVCSMTLDGRILCKTSSRPRPLGQTLETCP